MSDPLLTSSLAFFQSIHDMSLSILSEGYTKMSQGYRSSTTQKKQGFANEGERLSYLFARFPATYSACKETLNQLPHDYKPLSILDLGCGPGTASVASYQLFPSLHMFSLVESDPSMLSLAQDHLTHHGLSTVYKEKSLLRSEFPTSDIVLLSYVLTELTPEEQIIVAAKAWKATKDFLVVIIPGASHHFQDYLALRKWFIGAGAHIIAPCPNHLSCPMENTKDWCHFKARIQRTSMHKQIKGGSLGHEDEPYSYLIVSRSPPINLPQSRIIRRPLEKSGHIIFDVCTEGHLKRRIISRKDASYKNAKKLILGDSMENH